MGRPFWILRSLDGGQLRRRRRHGRMPAAKRCSNARCTHDGFGERIFQVLFRHQHNVSDVRAARAVPLLLAGSPVIGDQDIFASETEMLRDSCAFGWLRPSLVSERRRAGGGARFHFLTFPACSLVVCRASGVADASNRSGRKKFGGWGSPSITKTERHRSANLLQMPRGLACKPK